MEVFGLGSGCIHRMAQCFVGANLIVQVLELSVGKEHCFLLQKRICSHVEGLDAWLRRKMHLRRPLLVSAVLLLILSQERHNLLILWVGFLTCTLHAQSGIHELFYIGWRQGHSRGPCRRLHNFIYCGFS